MKNRTLKMLIGAVAIILIIIIFYVINSLDVSNDFTENKGITANEGRAIANPIALEINNTAKLLSVHAVIENGSMEDPSQWTYVYGNHSGGNDIDTSRFSITISGEEVKVKSLINKSVDEDDYMDILTIDSPEALRIGKEHYEIRQWLNLHNESKLISLMSYQAGGKPVWSIHMRDSPYYAHIWINANNGEVTTAETGELGIP